MPKRSSIGRDQRVAARELVPGALCASGVAVCLFGKIGGLRKRRLRYGFVVPRVGGAGASADAGARDVRRGGELCAESGE